MLGPAPVEVAETLARFPVEVAATLYFDRAGAMIGARHFVSGKCDHAVIPLRAVAGDVLAFEAAAVLLIHTHPRGDPTPSSADRATTRQLARVLKALDAVLIDHWVIGGGARISFRALGLC